MTVGGLRQRPIRDRQYAGRAGGRLDRPGHHLPILWSEAGAELSSSIKGLSIQWQGGALGYAPDGDCDEISGAQLKAWTGLGWETLDESTTSFAGHSWKSSDPDEIRRFFFGLPGQETLNFALTPLAPNGCGPEFGQVSTDYVEATVHYRLPAESP